MRILYNKTVKNKKAGKCFYTYLPVMEVTMAIKKSKPKNSNGDGSIAYEKERNKWRACIYDPEGNRLRPRFDTKEQAEEWLIEKKNEFNKNTYIAPSNITVGEWYLEYLQTFVFQNVGEKTQSDYLSIASHYLPIADIRLQDLTPVDIQRLYNSIDLAANSKVKIHSLLKQAIDKAFALRMINFNPMLAVNSPSAERVPVEVYTEQEVQHILSIVKYSRHYSRYYPFILTAVSTGARLGEILALKYHNILNRAIKIEHTIGTINGKMVERKPKTPAGRRIITIDGNLEKLLRATALISKTISIDGYIFHTANGTPFQPRNMDRTWASILKESEMPHKKFHALRHTHASHLLSHGEPITEVAKRLGHADPSYTLKLYGHFIPGYDKQIPETITKIYNLSQSV